MNDNSLEPKDPAEASEKESPGSYVPLTPRRAPTDVAQSGPWESANLIKLLEMVDADLPKKIGDTVIRDYDADVKSRAPRMRKIEKFQKLYASIMKAKSFPFQNCANVNLPFLTYPALQVHARLYDMVIPANGKIFLCSPTNLTDVERANLSEKFGNSYIRHKMDNFATGMDSTLLQVVINGSAFRRTYWNQYTARVCSDFIPVEDFVVAYWQRSDDPSMRDVPRYTMVQHLTIYDLEDYGAQGIYENVDDLKPEDGEQNSERDQLRATIDKSDGKEQSPDSTVEDKPRMVLEQHRKWRMPNKPKVHPSFDGRAHAVIVTVDEKSRRVLRVVVREEDDPDDMKRFERDQQAFDQHMAELDAHAQALQSYTDATAVALASDTPPEEIGEPPMPPAPPPGVEMDKDGMPVPPDPIRKREIAFFTHYKCFPGEGFYGHGFGDFLAPIAEAANTILNQHIDGVTLTNARPGFISRQLRGQRGAVTVQPGELTEVDAPMGTIKDGIAWLDPPQSDPTTMSLIELLQDMAEKFGGNDVMSGTANSGTQTARGTMVLTENAMAQLSVLSRRVKEAEKHELDKIWRLWGVFLPDEEISADVIDENGVPGTVQVSRALFTPDAKVMPASDVRMRSQKVEETMSLYQMAAQNPIIMQSRPAMQMLTEDVLRAMDAQKVIPAIQPPPPASPPPPQPHWKEDANFLRGQDQPVNPADDDHAHIQGHQAFMSSPAGAMLDKNSRDMLERHVRMHAANRLEKAGNDLSTELAGAPPIGVGTGGIGGLAGPPGDQGVPAMAG